MGDPTFEEIGQLVDKLLEAGLSLEANRNACVTLLERQITKFSPQRAPSARADVLGIVDACRYHVRGLWLLLGVVRVVCGEGEPVARVADYLRVIHPEPVVPPEELVELRRLLSTVPWDYVAPAWRDPTLAEAVSLSAVAGDLSALIDKLIWLPVEPGGPPPPLLVAVDQIAHHPGLNVFKMTDLHVWMKRMVPK